MACRIISDVRMSEIIHVFHPASIFHVSRAQPGKGLAGIKELEISPKFFIQFLISSLLIS
jgi:hypothetical protein